MHDMDCKKDVARWENLIFAVGVLNMLRQGCIQCLSLWQEYCISDFNFILNLILTTFPFSLSPVWLYCHLQELASVCSGWHRSSCRAEWVAANYLQAMPDLSTAKELAECNPVLFYQITRNMAEIEAVWRGRLLLGTLWLWVLFSLAHG